MAVDREGDKFNCLSHVGLVTGLIQTVELVVTLLQARTHTSTALAVVVHCFICVPRQHYLADFNMSFAGRLATFLPASASRLSNPGEDLFILSDFELIQWEHCLLRCDRNEVTCSREH